MGFESIPCKPPIRKSSSVKNLQQGERNFHLLLPRNNRKESKMGKKVTSKEGMVAEVKKKITEMQFELDKMSDEVDNLNKNLEEERELRETAESEVLALHRKIQLVEEDFDRTAS